MGRVATVTGKPPAFLQAFVDANCGWRMRQRDHDGGWIIGRRIVIANGGWTFRLLVVAGLDEPASERDWVGSCWADRAALSRYDGTFDEVVEEVTRAERRLGLIEEILHSPTRAAALRLVENLRGADLQFLRRALDLRRAPAEALRTNIVEAIRADRLRGSI